jgi:hypothetical protein
LFNFSVFDEGDIGLLTITLFCFFYLCWLVTWFFFFIGKYEVLYYTWHQMEKKSLKILTTGCLKFSLDRASFSFSKLLMWCFELLIEDWNLRPFLSAIYLLYFLKWMNVKQLKILDRGKWFILAGHINKVSVSIYECLLH